MVSGSTSSPERLRFPELVRSAESLITPGRRTVLGLVGPPAAGKSTLARRLVRALGPRAALFEMDGFHLSQAALATLGRSDRKGAPDTFDVDGYVAHLIRILQGDDVWVPAFRRDLEEPIAASTLIGPEAELVVTEGNYLLHDEGGWERVAPLLDRSWYLVGDDDKRRDRLYGRHTRFGRSEEEARDWIERTDEPNAELIARCRGRADVVVQVG
jgi:pantothenate kinase